MCSCQVCKSEQHDFSCDIIGSEICKSCCNKFQVLKTKGQWNNILVEKQIDEILATSEKCLKCKGLIRDKKDELKLDEFYSMMSFEHKDKYIFTNISDDSTLHFKKRKVLLETIGDTSDEGLYYLAETCYFLRELEKSKEILEKMLGKSECIEIPLLLSKVYRAKGDLHKAEQYLIKCIAIDDTNSEVLRILGELHEKKEDYFGSVYYYNRSINNMTFIDGGPKDFFSELNYLGLAVSYSKMEKYAEAIEAAELFLSWKLSWDHFKDSVSDHRAGVTKVIGIESDILMFSTIYELTAISYLELNSIELAEMYIDRAAMLSPENINIAKIKGIIIGRKYRDGEIEQYREQVRNLKISVELRASSINKLKTLTPEEQVKVFTGNDSENVHRFLIEKVLYNLKKVESLSYTINTSSQKPAEEDRYTDLFKSHLDSSLIDPLGWTTHTQSRGGYTREEFFERGGIGERDIVIYSHQDREMLIGEALILKTKDTASIKKHTEKVFGYDVTNCNFYVVITWGFSNNPDQLWSGYVDTVISRKDEKFALIGYGSLEELYSNINKQGLRTFYTEHYTDKSSEKAIVIHIYVDVFKEERRKIAEAARKN
ncbi:TPA: tetratricopeptide repeat protein [Bacillus luti]